MPDLRKGRMELLTLHHSGLSLFLPSPLTSTVIPKYSSLPEPLQLQSRPFGISSPTALPTTAGMPASYVSHFLFFSFHFCFG